MPTLALEAWPEAVPRARAFVRELLEDWGESELRDDVELVLTELMGNVVLHAPGEAEVVVEQQPEGVRLEVRDTSTAMPVRRTSGGAATTGRGLNLVAALTSGWGVLERGDGRPGKAVWCVVPRERVEVPVPDIDLDELMAAFTDEPDGFEVTVGEAPVALVLQAKDHLDGVLRELALAEGGAGLPQEVLEPMARAVRQFAEARGQLRALLTAAAARGDERVLIVFHLPLDLADKGEQYLAALAAADAFARDRRMLSLESPVEHRVLREWYVAALVSGLRRAAAGLPPLEGETFEARLVRELHELEQRQRVSQMGAQLQQVTARLAAAEKVEQIAAIALAEGVQALGAAGGTFTRLADGPGVALALAEVGADEGVWARYQARPVGERPSGPSSVALRTGEPVWIEGRDERDAQHPHLAELQPSALAVAAVPCLVAGQVVGALRLSWSTPHVFSQAERDYLQALASQTGQAVARADALGRLRTLRDELERLLSSGRISGTDLGVLRTLYEDAPVGIAVFDVHGRYLRINDHIARANGRPAAEHIGRTESELRAPGAGLTPYSARVEELVQQVIVEGRAVEEELRGGPSDGELHWQTSWFPVRDVEGQLVAVVLLAVEITAQRQAERRAELLAALGGRLSEDRSEAGVLDAVASALVPSLCDWIVVHLLDEHGQVWTPLSRHADPQLSDAFQEMFARFPVSLDQPYGVGRVLATGQTQEIPSVDEEVLVATARGDEAFLATMREVDVRSGVVVALVAAGRVLGALSAARTGDAVLAQEDVAVLEDVARRAAVALEGVRALSTAVRLDLALSAGDVGSYDWHVASGHLDWDERLFRLLDVDRDRVEGGLETFFARVHPDDADLVAGELERVVAGVGELLMQYRMVTRTGEVRWIEARGRALPGPDGKTERVVGTAMDVTSRRHSDARAERTLELMADAFFSVDHEWRVTYVNREAERVLARSRESLLGHVLWEAFPEAVGSRFDVEYRRAVETGEPVRFDQWFPPLQRHFDVRAYPGPEGLSVYFADVGQRRATEVERDQALARLGLLNEIGAALTATLDVDEALSRLAELLVPDLADLVSIDLRDSTDMHGARAVVITASDPAKADALRRADEILPRRHNPESSVYRVLHGEPLVHLVIDPDYLLTVSSDPEQLAVYRTVDMRYAAVVPLLARGDIFGVLSLIRTGAAPPAFTQDDLVFVQEVGRRAGLMVDNAAQYTAQRAVAEGLQRSLLPELPLVEGVVLGASYEPSSSSAKIGGDWYDAFVLPDGGLGLVIGDVMGHDIAAAAAMGQLRSVLRTCAADGDPPALVLDRLDRLVSSFAMADLATVIYARLDRGSSGPPVLSWANAGHPPPLLLRPDGSTTYLEEGGSVMIGAPSGESRPQAQQLLEPGSTLLMFTDGLVERRGRDLDQQLAELAETAALLWTEVDGPEELCRRLIATVRRDADTDDAAAVALTLL